MIDAEVGEPRVVMGGVVHLGIVIGDEAIDGSFYKGPLPKTVLVLYGSGQKAVEVERWTERTHTYSGIDTSGGANRRLCNTTAMSFLKGLAEVIEVSLNEQGYGEVKFNHQWRMQNQSRTDWLRSLGLI
jgi:hypothetical protein